jgi:predicted porin
MKRIALAAALMAAFAGSAMAQSSVTLYGRVNTSLEFQDNGDDDKSVMENNASRWGLRGSEDLGGGLSAFFQLEAGFGSDNGSGSGGFSRDSYVGLKSNSLGTIMAGKFLGELYYGTIDWIGMFNHNTGTTSEDNMYPLTAGGSNSVQYISPVIGGGFKFSALVAAGEGTTDKSYEGAVQWDSGPFHIGAGYRETEFVGGDKLSGYSIGGTYAWGNFTFGLNYAYGDDDFRGDRDHVQGTVMYALNQHEFHFSAGYTSSDDPVVGVGSGSASQWTLGYNYNLSKRTKLYAFYFSQDNGNAVYIGRSLAALPNETWSSFGAGIRHNF